MSGVAETGDQDQGIHPTRTDKIVAGVIATFWILLVGWQRILFGLASLAAGKIGNASGMAGMVFGGFILYKILLSVIEWYHTRGQSDE